MHKEICLKKRQTDRQRKAMVLMVDGGEVEGRRWDNIAGQAEAFQLEPGPGFEC